MPWSGPSTSEKGHYDRQWLAANRRFLPGRPRADQAAGRLHVPRLRGRRAAAADGSSDRSSSFSTGSAASTRNASRPGRVRLLAAHLQRCSACWSPTSFERLQQFLPLNPAEARAGRRRTWLSTRPPASPPTPTGRPTRGETTMSYLTQMAGLAWHNFTSAAAGIAVALAHGPRPHPQSRAGRSRGPSATSGSTWCGRSSTCCCRSASSARWCWSARA